MEEYWWWYYEVMFYFCLRTQIESLDMNECLDQVSQLSFMPFVIMEHLPMCNDWISWLNWTNHLIWLNLISSILWSDLSSPMIWFEIISLISWFGLITLTQNVLLLTSLKRSGKKLPQLHPRKYDCLVTDLTLNTRGWYIPILLVAFVVLSPFGHNHYRVI